MKLASPIVNDGNTMWKDIVKANCRRASSTASSWSSMSPPCTGWMDAWKVRAGRGFVQPAGARQIVRRALPPSGRQPVPLPPVAA